MEESFLHRLLKSTARVFLPWLLSATFFFAGGEGFLLSRNALAQGPAGERTDSGVEVRRKASTDKGTRSSEEQEKRVTRGEQDEERGERGSSDRLEIRRRAQDVSVDSSGPEPYRPPENPADLREALADAWASYDTGGFQEAEVYFTRASGSGDPGIRNEATLGLALSLAGRGENDRAAGLLEGLVREGYRPDETLPALIRVVLDRGDLKQAGELLGRMPDSPKRARLAGELKVLENRKRLRRIRRESSGPGLARLLEKNRALLAACTDPYLFIDAASRAAEMGESGVAVSVLHELLPCGEKDGDVRVEVLRHLAALLPFSKALDLLEREGRAPGGDAGTREKIRTLEVDLLKQRMKDLSPGTTEYRQAAERILELDPGQEGVRTELAWACLNAGEEEPALEQFSLLLEQDPANTEYVEGKCSALVGLGRAGEALRWLEQPPLAEDPELSPLRESLNKQQGVLLFEAGDYVRAEPYLTRAYAREPADPDIRNLLAWSYYHAGDLKAAQRFFLESFEQEPSEEAARNVLLTFEKLGEEDRASAWIRNLASDPDPSMRRIAAESYYDQGQPILAARTSPGAGTCFVNCDAPWGESIPYGRWRTGDPGLSRLIEAGVPLGVRVPWKRRMQWRFTLTPAWLDSGEAPGNPYAGSYYRFIDSPGMTQRPLRESAWVFTPEVELEREGDVSWRVRLGSTPVGGTVDPLPTFLAQALRRNDWQVNVHQHPVKESLLSYVGQRDPYADRTWGRVLRTGVLGSKTLWSRPPYWVSLEAGYDYYWGEQTVDNHRAGGTVSAGRTSALSVGELSLGALVIGQHFHRNTNFFTFGQGGYFSPQAYLMAGPFARFVTKRCRDIWIDAQISIGYVYYETSEASQYHGTGENPVALSPDARNNLTAVYDGETKSNFGLSARVQGLKLLGKRWALGGFAGVNSTTDHVEVLGGASVRFFFRPRETLCFTDNLFRAVQPSL